MKTLEERKKIIKTSHQKMNLLYQWVKDDEISYHMFISLLEYIYELQKEAYALDEET